MAPRSNPLYAACIARAAALLGGFEPLGAKVGVGPRRLKQWAEGNGEPPETVFLKIVDLLLDDGVDPTMVSAARHSAKPRPPKAK